MGVGRTVVRASHTPFRQRIPKSDPTEAYVFLLLSSVKGPVRHHDERRRPLVA